MYSVPNEMMPIYNEFLLPSNKYIIDKNHLKILISSDTAFFNGATISFIINFKNNTILKKLHIEQTIHMFGRNIWDVVNEL